MKINLPNHDCVSKKDTDLPIEELFNRLCLYCKICILKEEDCPIELWRIASKSSSFKDIIDKWRTNYPMPGEIQKMLVVSNDVYTRRLVASLSSITKEVGEVLLKDKDQSVKLFYASKAKTPEHLVILFEEGDLAIKKAVLENDECPEQVFDLIPVTRDSIRKFELVYCPRLPKKFVSFILQDPTIDDIRRLLRFVDTLDESDLRLIYKNLKKFKTVPYGIRALFVSYPTTPVDLLSAFENDPSITVKYALASNPRTPPGILAKLVNHRHFLVRKSAVKNPNTPLTALMFQLAVEGDQHIKDLIKVRLQSVS